MTRSALGAIFLSGFMPRRVAVAHRDTPLIRAYGIHWLALLLGAATLLTVLVQDQDFYRDILYLCDPGTLLTPGAAIVCVVVVVVAEALFVLLALLLLPWGDATARVGSLWRQALRTAWLHTGQLFLGAIAFAGVVIFCEWLSQPEFWQRYAPGLSHNAKNMLKWLRDEYEYILPLVAAAAFIWYLWALLRAMTTPLGWAEAPHPPLCEACGYNLSHHGMSARCPECGRPVALSVGNDVRWPVGWGCFRAQGCPTTFQRAALDAWFHSRDFFMRVSTARGLASAGRFLLQHLLLAALSFVVGFAVPFRILFPREPGLAFRELIYGIACAGAILALILGLLASLVAAIAGLVVSKTEKRNRLGACLRVTCFCSGIFPIWMCTFMASWVTLMWVLESIHWPPPRWFRVLLPTVIMGLNVGFLMLYVGGVLRRIRYVRYANS